MAFLEPPQVKAQGFACQWRFRRWQFFQLFHWWNGNGSAGRFESKKLTLCDMTGRPETHAGAGCGIKRKHPVVAFISGFVCFGFGGGGHLV